MNINAVFIDEADKDQQVIVEVPHADEDQIIVKLFDDARLPKDDPLNWTVILTHAGALALAEQLIAAVRRGNEIAADLG